MACGGRPTSTVEGGITAPAGTSVPSPRMQPSPIRAPGMRIAPLPISQRSPTVAPMTCARWPKTVRWPIRTRCSRVPTTTPFSRTAEWLPIDTDSSCERTTVPWAMIAPAPTWTLPSSLAEAAISGCGWSATSRLRLMTATRPSEDVLAVHLAERVGDQFDAGAVGVAEVDRDAAVHGVLDAGVGEPLYQLAPVLGVDADGHVVQAAEHLGVGADVQAGEVEEGDEVAVADVEEEMRGARVVAVLDQLGQREAEYVLVEAHGPLDVAADERGVVQPAGGRRRPLARGLEVRLPDPGALPLDGGQVRVAGGVAHGASPPGRSAVGTTAATRISFPRRAMVTRGCGDGDHAGPRRQVVSFDEVQVFSFDEVIATVGDEPGRRPRPVGQRAADEHLGARRPGAGRRGPRRRGLAAAAAAGRGGCTPAQREYGERSQAERVRGAIEEQARRAEPPSSPAEPPARRPSPRLAG